MRRQALLSSFVLIGLVSVCTFAGCDDDRHARSTFYDPDGGATGSGGNGGPGGMAGAGGIGGMGGEGGTGGEGGMIPCPMMGCLPGTIDLDNNPQTGACGGCEYACTVTSNDDPLDDTYTDDNCDGSDGLIDQCVYVSASEGSDTNSGTRTEPRQTIAAAIQQAKALGYPAVCLSGEVYNEQITLESGISVYGGFDHKDPKFKFRRKSSITTTIQAQGIGVLAPQIDAETHIEGLTIQVSASAQPGASNYGVLLSAGTGELYVRGNYISVAAGNDGAAGANGAAIPGTATGGNNGAGGCSSCSTNPTGGAAPMCNDSGGKGGNGGNGSNPGGPGSSGNGGAAGGGGGASNTCFGTIDNTKKGQPGTVGMAGSGGNAGAGATMMGSVVMGSYVPAKGGNGTVGTNGKGGGGGGGGGGGQGGLPCMADGGGGGGSGGCGGLPGNIGMGGEGGGGSFAIFAAAGNIIVERNKGLMPGKGGAGGKGGNGGDGQAGGSGGVGGGQADDAPAGGNGGGGGRGGAGGPGGGGAGGPSACVGYAAAAQITYGTGSAANTCTPGAPGAGGMGGTSSGGVTAQSGVNGLAGPTLNLN